MTGSAARVTIAVPVHNGERHLLATLDSMATQIYRDWEAVIVDDASTDGSRELVATFARAHPDRIRLICLERNVGVAEARNVAIRASSGGDLVALLDQDDCLREDYLASTVGMFDEAVAAGRRPGIVACNARLEAPAGYVGTFAERLWWRDDVDYDAMIERNYILARALFSRAAYEEVGGFCSDCLSSDDYDLWLRILEAGYTVLTTREPLVMYRIHAGAQSGNEQLLADGTIAVYRRALARGALSPSQRRVVLRRIRHFRALRERALVRAAWAERRRLDVARSALRAAPAGLVAFAQDPARWSEWLGSPLARHRDLRRPQPGERGSATLGDDLG